MQESIGKHTTTSNCIKNLNECEPGNTNQAMYTDCNQSMKCLPNSLSVGNNAFTIASNALDSSAREYGFTTQDVPYDSDCLHVFMPIVYQLESIGICSVALRQMVVDHLQDNSASYCNFLS